MYQVQLDEERRKLKELLSPHSEMIRDERDEVDRRVLVLNSKVFDLQVILEKLRGWVQELDSTATSEAAIAAQLNGYRPRDQKKGPEPRMA